MFKNDKGATVIEYALIASGLGIAVIGALFLTGDSIAHVLDVLAAAIDAL